MKAVLLAAGKGTRLRPLTESIPKVMIPINGKPILEYHIEQLAEAGIKDIFINLHHLPEKVKHYFQDGKKWGIKIDYSYETEILGTAGAIKKIEKNIWPESFLVVYGDNFLKINYREFMKFSESHNGIGTVAIFKKEHVFGSGILDIGQNMQIKRFKEKPNENEVFSHWVNAGVYCFKANIFKYIDPGFSDFGLDVLPRVLKNQGKLYAFRIRNEVSGIDRPELLEQIKQRYGNRKPENVRE